jgi:hypothetical protein
MILPWVFPRYHYGNWSFSIPFWLGFKTARNDFLLLWLGGQEKDLTLEDINSYASSIHSKTFLVLSMRMDK